MLKEQSLKLGLYFSYLKVTDTKEEDEQRAMNICIGWELLEVICYFVQKHKPQKILNVTPIERSVLVWQSLSLDLNLYRYREKVQARVTWHCCALFLKEKNLLRIWPYSAIICCSVCTS